MLLKVMSNELEQIMQEQVRQDDTWLQQYLSDLLWCKLLRYCSALLASLRTVSWNRRIVLRALILVPVYRLWELRGSVWSENHWGLETMLLCSSGLAGVFQENEW